MFYREARQLSKDQVVSNKNNSPTLNRCKDIDRAGCNQGGFLSTIITHFFVHLFGDTQMEDF